MEKKLQKILVKDFLNKNKIDKNKFSQFKI